MSDSSKLLKNTLIYTIGNLGSKILSFLLVPLYSFYLTKSDLGYYDLILTSITLLVPFVTVQISDATYRWLLDAGADNEKTLLAVSNGFFIIIINFLVFILGYLIITHFFKINYTFYFLILLLFASLFPYMQQIIRGMGNNRLYSIIGIANTVLLVIFNVIFLLVLKFKLEGILLATAIANCISIILVFYYAKIYDYMSLKSISKVQMKLMLKYSWPLIPNTISWWLINEVNRFIILYNMGAESNGIFALSNRFPAIIIIINSIFMLSWQDHAIGNHGKEIDNDFYTKVFNRYMVLELTLVILLTALSRHMVKSFIGPGFYDSWRYMPVLYLSVAFSSFAGFLGAGYLSAKKTTGIFATTIFGSVLNLIICYFFIAKIGLFAPSIGTLLGFALMWVVRIYQTKQFFTINIDYKVFSILILLTLVFIKFVFIENKFMDMFLIIFSIGLFILFNKTLFIFVLQSFKKKVSV